MIYENEYENLCKKASVLLISLFFKKNYNMKKYVLILVLVLGSLYGKSQTLESIRILVDLKQYDKAKESLDKFTADPKNAGNATALYYKAFVYSALARDAKKTTAESKKLYDDAYAALKKYAETDTKAELTKQENNSTIYNVYYGYYDLGVKTYNEKNYEESFNLFKSTLDVHDYGYDKKLDGPGGLKFAAHDTDVVWNLAVLANELKKKDDAATYYKRIADAGLADEKYATAYDELILKYKKENNAELFNKYLAAAKKHYPVDLPYWENKEIEFNLGELEDEPLLTKYEELTKALPNNYGLHYNYATEIDKFLGSSGANGKDAATLTAYKQKMEEEFKKAVAIKSTIEGNLQLANLYYSKTFDLQEQAGKIKGTKPAEVKLKADLTASAKTTMGQAIPYAEEAVKLLSQLKEYKFADKTNYKLGLEILANAYKVSGDAAKAAEIEKQKVTVEAIQTK